MKKSLIITCTIIASLSVTAFGIKNWKSTAIACHIPTEQEKANDSFEKMEEPIVVDTSISTNTMDPKDFDYKIGNRFNHEITKTELKKAKSIIDILPKRATENRFNYSNIKLAALPHNENQTTYGKNEYLTKEQIDLIQSLDYSSDFQIDANFNYKEPNTKPLNDDFLTYYFTLVPEKQAEYQKGNQALLDYLKENTKAEIAFVNQRDLGFGRIIIEIDADGKLSNVSLDSSCRYEYIDLKMIQLFNTLPGNWNPAKNNQGKPVNQKLIFFYGQMGC